MLYSIGKDSAVMLHLAVKAFYPAVPPFPLLHVDTTWKFRAMYEFRDRTAQRLGMQLLVHVNQEGLGARHRSPDARLAAAHRGHEDPGAEAGARAVTASTPPSAARAATRRRAVPRSASSRSAPPRTAGTPNSSAPSSGRCTTPASARARACGYFHCRTGPSSTCGSTSGWRTFRSCRCTSQRSARSCSARVRSSWWTTSACCSPRASSRS